MFTFCVVFLVVAIIYFACDEVIIDACGKVIDAAKTEAKEAKEVFDECYR